MLIERMVIDSRASWTGAWLIAPQFAGVEATANKRVGRGRGFTALIKYAAPKNWLRRRDMLLDCLTTRVLSLTESLFCIE